MSEKIPQPAVMLQSIFVSDHQRRIRPVMRDQNGQAMVDSAIEETI
jgi:hypothetical protein